MIFVHASSTPSTISVRSRSEMGILSRKWRTKLRISARLPGWLENSSFLFFISDRITLARVTMASSFDHRKIRAAERATYARQSIPPDRLDVVTIPPIQRLRSQNLKTAVDTIRKRGSIPGMLKSFAALLFAASAVFAQANPTAYDALRTVGNQVNRDFVNRVVSVTGVDGNPQPSTWRILIDDPNARGGIREVEVTDGRITSNRVSSRQVTGTPQGATVNPARLNLDSSGAYEVASRTADSSHVPFALVSYTLRTSERGDATWVVTLQNQNRRPVGTIYIGANKGTVTRTEGMFAGAPMNAVVEDHREGDVEDEKHSGDNRIMRNVRQMFYRAREQAQETFKRVRHNFADYIRGND